MILLSEELLFKYTARAMELGPDHHFECSRMTTFLFKSVILSTAKNLFYINI